MHAISCASPSHVRIGNVYYDVICWTVEDGGHPAPWIIDDNGELTAFQMLPRHLHPALRAGTAREAVEDGR